MNRTYHESRINPFINNLCLRLQSYYEEISLEVSGGDEALLYRAKSFTHKTGQIINDLLTSCQEVVPHTREELSGELIDLIFHQKVWILLGREISHISPYILDAVNRHNLMACLSDAFFQLDCSPYLHFGNSGLFLSDGQHEIDGVYIACVESNTADSLSLVFVTRDHSQNYSTERTEAECLAKEKSCCIGFAPGETFSEGTKIFIDSLEEGSLRLQNGWDCIITKAVNLTLGSLVARSLDDFSHKGFSDGIPADQSALLTHFQAHPSLGRSAPDCSWVGEYENLLLHNCRKEGHYPIDRLTASTRGLVFLDAVLESAPASIEPILALHNRHNDPEVKEPHIASQDFA